MVLSWNPHCGHCFHCARGQPILCEPFLANGPKALHFDGRPRLACDDGGTLHQLMYLGGFSEYVVVPAQQAMRVPAAIPPDRACLLGCAVMTGFGGATHVARIEWGMTVMVIGTGAVGPRRGAGCAAGGAGPHHRGRSQPGAAGDGGARGCGGAVRSEGGGPRGAGEVAHGRAAAPMW